MSTDHLPECFHPLIRHWFETKVGQPTDIQCKAWPLIAAGEHVFAVAPTGSGKTLTAFLWALNQLLTGAWPAGSTSLLYVSPLKALNNDIRKNLLGPLADLQESFSAAGIGTPPIRSMVRSGDTPQAERRSMLRHPPEIFICTPESLAIMLTSASGQALLGGLRAVILDEIHAVAGSKRGTALMASVERLVDLSGEIQRIALSATVNPVQELARFVAGYQAPECKQPVGDTAQSGVLPAEAFMPRPIQILQSAISKKLQLEIVKTEPPLWENLTEELYSQILRHQSTLIFVQSRRMAERLTRYLNDRHNSPEPLVYSHHGSLSREIRLEVEGRLKTGRLRGIVATGSLELGIDIGDLDMVLQVGVPDAVSSALQRLGRAGHGVGQLSRGILYPLHEKEELEAEVLRALVLEGRIEALSLPDAPLDVLAQLLLSLCVRRQYSGDQLFNLVRRIGSFNRLSRPRFQLILDMLCGTWQDTRLRELAPRLFLDPLTACYSARPGVEQLLYMNGGTIPDRGYFALRTSEGEISLGELDEEFVWERKIGDSFALGGRAWKIESIDHNHVRVAPAANAAGLTPFWKADRRSRAFAFCERVGLYLEALTKAGAADQLPALLQRQAASTGVFWPHRHHLVFESCALPDQQDKGDGLYQYLLHTLWGRRINQPLAFAFAAAWQQRHGTQADVFASNDSIYLSVDRPLDGGAFFEIVQSQPLETLLRHGLESTAFFGARFRENAGRAILLPRRGFGLRQPFWMTRLRSKRLWEAVKPGSDFPILLETWREILQDEFDMPTLRLLLDEVGNGAISLSTVQTDSVSPFGSDMVWQQTNRYMYEDDAPETGQGAAYSGDPVADALRHDSVRPLLPVRLCLDLEARLQGKADGYEPDSPTDFLQLVRDRILTEENELAELIRAVGRAAGQDGQDGLPESWWPELRMRLCFADMADTKWLCSLDQAQQLQALPPPSRNTASSGQSGSPPAGEAPATLQFWEAELEAGRLRPGNPVSLKPQRASTIEPANLISQWLSFYGPMPTESLLTHRLLGGYASQTLLDELAENGRIVVDILRETSVTQEICDSENLERLLRLRRNQEKYRDNTFTKEDLQWLRARQGGLASPAELPDAVSLLEGWVAKAEAWETSLLPVRVRDYRPSQLDTALQENMLGWRALGRGRLGLLFPENAGLLWPDTNKESKQLETLMPVPLARYDFFDLQAKLRTSSADTGNFLWEQCWTGAISASSFQPVRQGIENGFHSIEAALPVQASHGQTLRSRLRHSSFREWQKNRPLQSAWYRWPNKQTGAVEDAASSELIKLENSRERVRLLLERYGFLCPPLLARERDSFGWKQLRKTLLLMELSGELVAGLFFPELPGPQYCSRQALTLLQNPEAQGAEHRIYWLCATDPASPVGLYDWTDWPEAKNLSRIESTWLVFNAGKLIMTLRRNGLAVDIMIEPDNPVLTEAFGIFRFLVERRWHPVSPLRVEKINNAASRHSPWRCALQDFGFRQNNRWLELWRDL